MASMFQKVIFLIIGLAVVSVVVLELNMQRQQQQLEGSSKDSGAALLAEGSGTPADGDKGTGGGKLASLRRSNMVDGGYNKVAGAGADSSDISYGAAKGDIQFASVLAYLSESPAVVMGSGAGAVAAAGGSDDAANEQRLEAVLQEEETGSTHRYRWDKKGARAATAIPDVSSAALAIVQLMARGDAEQLRAVAASRSESSSSSKAQGAHAGAHLKGAQPTSSLGHPRISPRNGTAATSVGELSRILRCADQGRCLVPRLQLAVSLRVYMCKHTAKHGVRFYFLVAEGLRAHPGVTLVEDPHAADFVLYLPGSAPWHLTECTPKQLKDRLIVLDEFDGHPLYSPRGSQASMVREYGPDMVWNFMMFKRSYNARRDGVHLAYPHIDRRDVFPLTYAISETYSRAGDSAVDAARPTEIACTLRGHKKMSTRQRVQDWVGAYSADRGIADKVVLGAVNKGSRDRVNEAYFQQMRSTKIVVTVNPAHWEGDFRLWEALATGALVFVDRMFTPHPYPLRDGQHVVFFNNSDRADLFRKLDFYRAYPLRARAVALNGYLHAMTHHRTVNLVDYILRTAHAKVLLMGGEGAVVHNSNFNNDYFQRPAPLLLPYSHTGQHFVREMRRQLKALAQGRWLDLQ